MKRNVLFISLIMFLFVGIISCEKEESEEDTTTDSTSSDSNTDQSTTKNVDFEDLSLSAESSWNGSDGSGGFVSGEVTFDTYYTTSPDTFWHGFAYSNTTDDTTAGISNWASAYAASGVSGSDNYGVFYYDAFGDSAMYISFNAEVTMKSVFVTNNTYAALVMKDGDATFGIEPFGGTSGDEQDWYKAAFYGYKADGTFTDSVVHYLADYRFSDNSKDYIQKEWEQIDLSPLGKVKKIKAKVFSSDVSSGYMNTPAYFCIDNLTFEE